MDTAKETLVSVGRLVEHPLLRQGRRPGRPVSNSTVKRWIDRGSRTPSGEIVKLGVIRVGGTRMTTIEELERFLSAIAGEAITITKGVA